MREHGPLDRLCGGGAPGGVTGAALRQSTPEAAAGEGMRKRPAHFAARVEREARVRCAPLRPPQLLHARCHECAAQHRAHVDVQVSAAPRALECAGSARLLADLGEAAEEASEVQAAHVLIGAASVRVRRTDERRHASEGRHRRRHRGQPLLRRSKGRAAQRAPFQGGRVARPRQRRKLVVRGQRGGGGTRVGGRRRQRLGR